MPDLSFRILSAELKPLAVIPTLQFTVEIVNAVEGERILSISLLPEVHLDVPPRGLYWGSVATAVSQFVGTTTATIPVPCSQEADLQVNGYLEKKRPSATEDAVLLRVVCKSCRSERERLAPRPERAQIAASLSSEPCVVCGSTVYDVKEQEPGKAGGVASRASGDIPFKLVFYGSAVYQSRDGGPFYFWPFPQLPPKEARFWVPADTWRRLMREHFGESRWVRLSAETFNKIEKFRQQKQLADFSKAVDELLAANP